MDPLNQDLKKKKKQMVKIRLGQLLRLYGLFALILAVFLVNVSIFSAVSALIYGTLLVCIGDKIVKRAKSQKQNDEEKEKW